MDGSVLSGAGKVICGGGLLALKRVPARSDTLVGEFAERVALGVQEGRLSNVAWVHVPRYRNYLELTQNWLRRLMLLTRYSQFECACK